MDPWITIDELSVWTQENIAPEDPFATTILKAATIVVSSATGYHETEHEFTPTTAPDRLKVVVAQVAKRNYLNPTQIRTEGSIGPLGGDTYAEAYAAGMTLTEEEQAVVAKAARDAVEGASSGNAVGVLRFGVAHNPSGQGDRNGWAPDSSGSDWLIPMGLP